MPGRGKDSGSVFGRDLDRVSETAGGMSGGPTHDGGTPPYGKEPWPISLPSGLEKHIPNLTWGVHRSVWIIRRWGFVLDCPFVDRGPPGCEPFMGRAWSPRKPATLLFDAVEYTPGTLTSQGGLGLFSRYPHSIDLIPQLDRLFGSLRKSSKSLLFHVFLWGPKPQAPEAVYSASTPRSGTATGPGSVKGSNSPSSGPEDSPLYR